MLFSDCNLFWSEALIRAFDDPGQRLKSSVKRYLPYFQLKDARGWQFLTIEAAETLCMVCLPPEEYILGN